VVACGIEVVPVGAGGGCRHADAGRFAQRSPPLPLEEPLMPLLEELVPPLLEEVVTPLEEPEKPELLPLPPPEPPPASLPAATEPPQPETRADE
jgi:hypothetical protein